MKTTLSLFVFFLAFNVLLNAQTTILDADTHPTTGTKDASEGDHYIGDPSGTIFIGLSTGLYQPIYKTLGEFLAIGNSAGNQTISNLADPVNPQDAATKNYVDSKSTGIYKGDGALTNDRILKGGGVNLTYNNLSIQSVSANQLNITSTENNILSASNSINLNSNTNIIGNLHVSGIYYDTSFDPGINEQLLSATGTGTNWIPGTIPAATPIMHYTNKSSFSNTWADTGVEDITSIEITTTETSIFDINYNFNFFRLIGKEVDNRAVYVNITGSAIINAQMISTTNIYMLQNASSSTVLSPTLNCDKMFELPAGTYTFTLKTESDIVYPSSQDTSGIDITSINESGTNDDYTGWSFEICVTPVSI
ncbi:MAG: hypothetical protein JKY08_01960 [Flavobacteriaceae bacterium]|nr:hypothetical protein [Flavobacteriaceae bacterium]